MLMRPQAPVRRPRVPCDVSLRLSDRVPSDGIGAEAAAGSEDRRKDREHESPTVGERDRLRVENGNAESLGDVEEKRKRSLRLRIGRRG
jgi:hypothetical protein